MPLLRELKSESLVMKKFYLKYSEKSCLKSGELSSSSWFALRSCVTLGNVLVCSHFLHL